MSDEKPNVRLERIEQLLQQLRYEIEVGMMQHEIDETISFEFAVPLSRAIPDGIVLCRFQTRPMPRHAFGLSHTTPRLRVVK